MLALFLALQAAAVPAPADSLPPITLADALQRAAQLDPNYVAAVGQIDNAEGARRRAVSGFILPSVTLNTDIPRQPPKGVHFVTVPAGGHASDGASDGPIRPLHRRAETGRVDAVRGSAGRSPCRRAAGALRFGAAHGVGLLRRARRPRAPAGRAGSRPACATAARRSTRARHIGRSGPDGLVAAAPRAQPGTGGAAAAAIRLARLAPVLCAARRR